MTENQYRNTNQQHEQEAINKIAIKYLTSAKKLAKHKALTDFIDESTEAIKQGNSNVSYDELDTLSRANNDDKISVLGVLKLVNASMYYWMHELQNRIRKFKDRGDYSKMDVELEIEKARLSRKDRKSFSRNII